MLYTDRNFSGKTIELDGNQFINCQFYDCRLIFSATAPVTFDECVFNECDWSFEGPADIMLSFLTALYHGLGVSGQNLVALIFDGIRDRTFIEQAMKQAAAARAGAA
jgi:hypothetical protein